MRPLCGQMTCALFYQTNKHHNYDTPLLCRYVVSLHYKDIKCVSSLVAIVCCHSLVKFYFQYAFYMNNLKLTKTDDGCHHILVCVRFSCIHTVCGHLKKCTRVCLSYMWIVWGLAGLHKTVHDLWLWLTNDCLKEKNFCFMLSLFYIYIYSVGSMSTRTVSISAPETTALGHLSRVKAAHMAS